MSALRIFVIAGEPSGDRLGAALLAGLRELAGHGLIVEGIGGPEMEAAGLRSRFAMEELSVMGAAEVVPRLPNLLRRIGETASAVAAMRPDALVTIDSPDFCLRVARKARGRLPDLKVIHYVAPSVWAWRPGRAARMARVVHHVLALLPFEPPYMQAAGMTCDFVGHPVVTEPRASSGEIAAVRAELGIAAETPLLVVLPGSRRGEVVRMAPIFAETIRLLRGARPDLAAVVPVGAAVADVALRLLPPDPAGWPKLLGPGGDTEARKRAAFAAADVALAKSGTVSLELAAAGTPMVIAYAFNPVSAWLARRLLRIDTATLVNLVTETRAVPEFFFDRCRPDLLAPAVARLLDDPASAAEQRAAAARTMTLLGAGGEAPGLRAARSVLAAIRR